MNMEAPATAGTAQGDLADVVARAGAIMAAAAPPSTSHHPQAASSLLAAADHTAMAAAGQIMVPYYEEEPEPRPACSDAVMFDPYLPSSSAAAPPLRGAYSCSWLPPQQLALQISQHHACYARDDVAMAGAATDDVDGDEAMRIVSPAAHQIMKSRKNEVKKVVCIPALPPTSSRPGGGEVIPSDLWAWRKYGQKPIKGSPYPRGYYRCSSSKGCMARKQVERSRSDPNMLVITYTAEHNHPWPMQRNVLAGYSRPHASSCGGKKKNICRVVVGPSKTNNADCHSEEHAVDSSGINLEGQQTADMMEGNAASADHGYVALDHEEGTVAMMHQPMSSCNNYSIQTADEVFAELEELEPAASNPASANIYSRGVSYEWHKF